MKAIIQPLVLQAGLLLVASGILAQIPKLSSYPSAAATIYLDFDGQYVTGTSWNWNGPINALPAELSISAIIEIYNRISEDYSPFNLNITTDSAVYSAAPFNKRMRIIITPSSSWYGRAGGVAFVGSFNWGDGTPAWVFGELLANNAKYISEASSHEVGHTLGLHHQSTYDASCNKIAEYNTGQGEGEIGWAPIMGVGYYKNLTTWHTGSSSTGCSYIQNDLSIISGIENNFGFRTDDHGGTTSTATDVNMLGQAFSVNGLINTPGDVDEFKIELHTTTNLRLNATPKNVGTGNEGADIDIKIVMLNAVSDTIGTYNPTTLLGAGLDTNLNNGTYYISITATGNINHSDYGSLGFYSLTGNIGNILPVHNFVLKAIKSNGSDVLNWRYTSDEPVKNIIVETSADGNNFQPLASLDATATIFSYKSYRTNFYRLKAVTSADERYYYSNISKVIINKEAKTVQLSSNLVHNGVTLRNSTACYYQLFDAGGKVLQTGNLTNNTINIDVSKAPNGILFLRITNGVDDWIEKLIKQ